MTKRREDGRTRGKRLETLRKASRYLRGYRRWLALSMALAVASTLATLYIPRIVGRAIDCVVGPGEVDFGGVVSACVQIVACAAFYGLAQFLMTLSNNQASCGAARELRNAAFRKLETLPMSRLDARGSGELASRVVTDADVFADGLALGFAQIFTGVVAILGTLFFMVSISLPIALVVVALTPLSFAVAGFISRTSHHFFKAQSERRGDLAEFANEAAQGARVMQAFNRAAPATREFVEKDARLAAASLKATFYSSLTNPATRFVNSVVYATVAVVGALAVLNGRMTVGSLVTFLSYADQYGKPFNEISSVATEFQNALACAERLFELIEAEPETPDPADARAPKTFVGRVEFDDVSFSYVPERPLIERFRLKVEPGMRVAIVGPTGCGKTTLVNLLMRFYDPVSGAILVDGFDAKKTTRASLRAGFGMVLQETWLKSGTVRDNILMGAPNVSDEELWRVAKACRVDALINRLPQRLDTPVSENGDEFSQGERQLLCVARVMARNPEMLILDEATSSIDARSELKVQAAFDLLMKGRTSFVVAHRLSTIREADVILAMKDGAIVERGTHEELLAKRGFYYNLYMSQFPDARRAADA